MGEWKQADPVGDQVALELSVAHHKLSLELDDLTNAGNCVVSSVLILSLLDLLCLNLGSERKVNCSLKGLETHLSVQGEGSSTVLTDNADSVTGCLSQTRALVVTEAADRLNDLVELVL